MIRPWLWLWLPGCGLYLGEQDFLDAVDLDGDGVRGPAFGGGDCDDQDPSVFPGAPDVPYDGIDRDCDGGDDFDADRDGLADAGHGGTDCDDADVNVGADPAPWFADCDDDGVAGVAAVVSCAAPERPLPPGTEPCATGAGPFVRQAPPVPDCDDLDARVAPGRQDPPYDGVDADCAGDNDFDVDRDGFVAVVAGARPDADAPGVGDCDDAADSVFPGAPELPYDGVDGDCDGANDFDADLDGFVADDADRGGSAPFGGDCDDADGEVHPGAADAPYDGADVDCDGGNDWDADRDGAVSDADAAHAGALVTGDCDDADAARGPLATEVWYDGVDQDCDGADDFDRDGDGVARGADCDDRDAAVRPGAVDAPYDGVDSDCAGDDDFDVDGDTWRAAGAGDPPGATDCDDTAASVYPGAIDAPYDGRDADCDGRNDWDADGDGTVLDPYVLLAQLPGGDCDDRDARRSPLLAERWYDGLDGDCAGGNDYDADGDGFVAAPHPEGADPVTPVGDCDDTDRFVHPAAVDVPYDGVDRDCGGDNDYDADGDGFVSTLFAGTEGGTAPRPGDCDDAVASVSPAAVDAPYDGIDADCAGDDDFDVDADGARWPVDCDDRDPARSPLLAEVPYDGIDADCAGGDEFDVDGDGAVAVGYDGFASPGDAVGDCDDQDPAVRPGRPDPAYDGVDTDCDGRNDWDADGDSWVALGAEAFAGGSAPLVGDCDDTDADTNPGALDDPAEPADRDCDGAPGDFDVDGDGVPVLTDCSAFACDCDDTDATVWVGDRVVAPTEALQPLLDAACVGSTLTLATGTWVEDLVLDRAVQLVGAPGAVVRGAGGRTVLVTGSGVLLRSLRVEGGAADAGGCLRVDGAAALEDVDLDGCVATGAGGAVFVTGALAAVGGTVSGGSAASGGGLAVAPTGVVSWVDAVFVDDDATTDGGAVFVDGGALTLTDAEVVGGSAARDGGALFSQDGELDVVGLVVDGSAAGRWGGALRLSGGGGVLADVSLANTTTSGPYVQLGGALLPSVVNLDAVGSDLVVERMQLVDNAAPVGLSVYWPQGRVDVHDLIVLQSATSLAVSLEPGPGSSPGTTVRNVWVEGGYDGLRIAPGFTSVAPTTVENATLVATATPLWVTTAVSPLRVRNVVALHTGFLGSGVLWTDYAQWGSSDLGYSWTVGGSGWVVGPPPLTALGPGVGPAFCPTCTDLALDPFGPDRVLTAGSGLLGAGDPSLCAVTDPSTCLDPGYWGGPATPGGLR